MNIIAISGSLRKESYNTKLVHALAAFAPEGMQITVADISAIPLYNQDTEKDSFSPEAQALKDAIEKADGIVIATPEYNRSVPGVLKNAIDWASRPYGQNSFAGKPVLVMGVSGGKIGTAVAQSHLRGILLHLDAHVIGQPELYLTASDVFDETGAFAGDATHALLTNALAVLASRGA